MEIELTNLLWPYVFKLNAASDSLEPTSARFYSRVTINEATTPLTSDAQETEIEISQQLLASAASLTKAIKKIRNSGTSSGTKRGALRSPTSPTFSSFRVDHVSLVHGRHAPNTRDEPHLPSSKAARTDPDRTLSTPARSRGGHRRCRARLVLVWADDARNCEGTASGLAEQDSSADVRRRALALLREARVPVPEEMWLTLPLWDDEDSVRAAAFEYLATIGDETVLPILEQLSTIDDSPTALSAREARFSVLMLLRPEEAFSQMVETGAHASDAKLKQLEERASRISDSELLKGAASQWGQVRKFAVQELANRGHLPRLLTEQLTADPSVTVREIAFTELAKQGLIDFEKVKRC